MSQFPEERLDLSAEQGFGYFPAYPGLTLKQDRYKIIRKLGFGPRSSVWLALDVKGDNEYSAVSAVKILTTHATAQETRELRTLQTFAKTWHLLPNLYDNFVEQSHQGKHQCFVLSVVGPDVETLRLTSPTKSLPVHIVRKVIASVLQPLYHLHGCGIVHGAIRGDNLSFFVGERAKDFERKLATLPPSVIQQKVTEGMIEYPIVLSQPIPHGHEWNEDQEGFADCSIFLNNFGHTQSVYDKPTWEKAGVDLALRPPEVILGTDFDTKVDIWMLGCATYQLLTGEPLVPPAIAEDDKDHLEWMMAMSNDSIKKTMALKSERRDEFFTDDGIYLEDEIPDTDLEAALKASGKVAEQVIPEIVEFVERCLALDPADRPSVDDLLDHPWLQEGLA